MMSKLQLGFLQTRALNTNSGTSKTESINEIQASNTARRNR